MTFDGALDVELRQRGYFLCLSGGLTVDSLLLCLSGVMTVDSELRCMGNYSSGVFFFCLPGMQTVLVLFLP
jgi:hypothetical protein